MTVDFHTHIFPDKIAPATIKFLSEKSGIKNKTDGTVSGLYRSMQDSGTDISVVLPVATKPSQFNSINRFAYEVNEKYDGSIISFGGIHPESGNYKEELRTIKSMGFPGIKLHPDYQDIFIDDIACRRVIYEASALGLIITVHSGIDIGYPDPVRCPPEKILAVIDEIKPEKLVLAHLGGWKQWDSVEELLCGRDVWLDTAFCLEYIEKEQFYRIIEKHGYEKILFSTDSPWSGQKEYIEQMAELLPDEKIRKAIMGENALKLLNL